MQCAIYAPGELAKRRRMDRSGVLVLARYREMLILERDTRNALWRLPGGQTGRGESEEDTARRVLGEALGEAVFDIGPLCGYGITDEDGHERGGRAFLADVHEWPAERESQARAFARLPLGSQTADAALAFGLHKWAGEFFDERLAIERLGEPAPY